MRHIAKDSPAFVVLHYRWIDNNSSGANSCWANQHGRWTKEWMSKKITNQMGEWSKQWPIKLLTGRQCSHWSTTSSLSCFRNAGVLEDIPLWRYPWLINLPKALNYLSSETHCWKETLKPIPTASTAQTSLQRWRPRTDNTATISTMSNFDELGEHTPTPLVSRWAEFRSYPWIRNALGIPELRESPFKFTRKYLGIAITPPPRGGR